MLTVIKTLLAANLVLFPVTATSGQALFAAIGDYGDGSANESDVAALVGGWNPDFIITLGDNRYGPTNLD